MKQIPEGTVVTLIGATYFLLPIVTALGIVYGQTGQYEYLPSGSKLLAAFFSGLASGIVALQGYLSKRVANYDQRFRSGNGGTP